MATRSGTASRGCPRRAASLPSRSRGPRRTAPGAWSSGTPARHRCVEGAMSGNCVTSPHPPSRSAIDRQSVTRRYEPWPSSGRTHSVVATRSTPGTGDRIDKRPAQKSTTLPSWHSPATNRHMKAPVGTGPTGACRLMTSAPPYEEGIGRDISPIRELPWPQRYQPRDPAPGCGRARPDHRRSRPGRSGR